MNKSIHGLVVTALVCLGVSGCKPAAKDAGSDTTVIQAKALPESATKSAAATTAPVESTTAPAIAAAPQAKPKLQAPIKDAVVPKTTGGAPATDAAKAEAARADSIRQAQERADAMRTARLDSVKRAETAKAAVKTEPSVARTEEALPAGTDLAAQGKVPYQENCRKCHGVIGVPPKTMKAKFPKIATFDAEFMAKHSADSIVTVLTNGKNEDMKSFKDKLSHSEMVAVAAYIRSFAK